jgi:hypothetical protein
MDTGRVASRQPNTNAARYDVHHGRIARAIRWATRDVWVNEVGMGKTVRDSGRGVKWVWWVIAPTGADRPDRTRKDRQTARAAYCIRRAKHGRVARKVFSEIPHEPIAIRSRIWDNQLVGGTQRPARNGGHAPT